MEGTVAIDAGPDPSTAAFLSADELHDIQLQVLSRYGASPNLLALFEGLAAGSRHVFGDGEVESLRLRRTLSDGAAQAVIDQRRWVSGLPLFEPLQEVGGPRAAAYLVYGGSDRVEEQAAVTRWYRSTAGPPGVMSTTYTVDRSVLVVVRFFRLPPDRPLAFSDAVVIEIASAGSTATEVTTFRVSNEAGEMQPLYFVQVPEGLGDFQQYAAQRFLLLISRAYSDITHRRYAEYDRFVVGFEFEDGTGGAFVFAMGPDARTLFDSALAEWAE